MTSRTLLAAVAMLALCGTAVAQPAPSTPPGPTGRATIGSAGARQPSAQPPRPGAAPAPVRRRSYDQCNREAQGRRLRGSERRHFVSRCQLGYGRPLFRRRGPV